MMNTAEDSSLISAPRSEARPGVTHDLVPHAAASHAGVSDEVILHRVEALIRHCSESRARVGYRIVAPSASGHIFFDAGCVVHAEFGEDCGLRAVRQMLRSGPVQVRAPLVEFPAQARLHLAPELLLSMVEGATSRATRRAELPVEPPPLPDPALSRDLDAPVREGAGAGPRPSESGVMRKLPARGASEAGSPSRRGQLGGQPSVVVVRPLQRPGSTVAAQHPALRKRRAQPVLRAVAELQPTTMVRMAPNGELLAARGKNAEQIAEAAAFIHSLASLIAADFGRPGRANVHLHGEGVSLLVARSEVNDIAAALGPTERVRTLLGKVGLE